MGVDLKKARAAMLARQKGTSGVTRGAAKMMPHLDGVEAVPAFDAVHTEQQAAVVQAPINIDAIQFSSDQLVVLDTLLDTRDNVLLTGAAGSGKSTIVREYIKKRRAQGRVPVILAPTGLAALQIGGQTIHSFFNLAPQLLDPVDLKLNFKLEERLRALDEMVIDEISMVRADVFDAMDKLLRLATRKHDLPFGGKRVIMVGDFFQLPPVVRNDEEWYFKTAYGVASGWMFTSHAFGDMKPKCFYLGQSFRQKDDTTFATLLNRMRDGDVGVVKDINQLARFKATPDNLMVRLAPTNKLVDDINTTEFYKLKTPVGTLEAEISGDIKPTQYPHAQRLNLREGARVMTMVNASGYVNGSIGAITGFRELEMPPGTIDIFGKPAEPETIVDVRLDEGGVVGVRAHAWEVVKYEPASAAEGGSMRKVVVGTFKQMPLRLAWALTIHKSQGQSFDAAVIDMGRGAFAHGQLYVALSRVRTLGGLYLTRPIQPRDVIIDKSVVAFLKGFMP